MACAAANATLDIFENENVIEENKKTSAYMAKHLERFEGFKNIKEIRQTGMIAAIELKGYTSEERIGLTVYEYALTKGVLLRPLGHIVYFMPPYIICEDEMDLMFNTAFDAIKLLPQGKL